MEKRYIDADDAIYELDRVFSVDDFKKIIRAISRTPTADVVEVVRCKDCSIRYTSCPMVVRQSSGMFTFFTEDDAYCSYGRRE